MKIDIDFKVMKTQFFDKPITDHLSKQAKSVLSRMGRYVRTTSRQSIRKARRKRDSELTNKEREIFNIRLRQWAEGKISKKPQRPLAPSKPGDPPRSRQRKSPIKLIYYIYDPKSQSVIIGPIQFGRRPGVATEALEYGGMSTNYQGKRVNIKNRPFMTPAFQKHLPDLAKWKAT